MGVIFQMNKRLIVSCIICVILVTSTYNDGLTGEEEMLIYAYGKWYYTVVIDEYGYIEKDFTVCLTISDKITVIGY